MCETKWVLLLLQLMHLCPIQIIQPEIRTVDAQRIMAGIHIQIWPRRKPSWRQTST